VLSLLNFSLQRRRLNRKSTGRKNEKEKQQTGAEEAAAERRRRRRVMLWFRSKMKNFAKQNFSVYRSMDVCLFFRNFSLIFRLRE
jgi:hypothetical protein